MAQEERGWAVEAVAAVGLAAGAVEAAGSGEEAAAG